MVYASTANYVDYSLLKKILQCNDKI